MMLCWKICLAVLGDEIEELTPNELAVYLAQIRDKAEQWDKTVEFFNSQSSASTVRKSK